MLCEDPEGEEEQVREEQKKKGARKSDGLPSAEDLWRNERVGCTCAARTLTSHCLKRELTTHRLRAGPRL